MIGSLQPVTKAVGFQSFRNFVPKHVSTLGRNGSSYFCLMEFVEGETLENLIKRSGRLEARLALEITAQAAAGLTAVPRRPGV
jgi:hypothetical protein